MGQLLEITKKFQIFSETHSNIDCNLQQKRTIRGYLCYKTIFCHEVALDV